MMSWGDIAGLTGAGLQLAGYTGVQFNRLDPQRMAALALNLLGSGLLIFSLLQRFNLAAFLLEGAWAAIACSGLINLWMKNSRLSC